MKKSSICGSLIKIAWNLHVTVIPTLNLEDTALVIEKLALQENHEISEFPMLACTAPRKLNRELTRIWAT